MEAKFLYLICYLSMAMYYCCGKTTNNVHALESPDYRVIKSESDFEIRLYNESIWMSAVVQGSSFEQSTKSGFHRLYQYLHGANQNSSKLEKTAPILTSFASSSPANDFNVKLYVSANYQGKPPQPNPELKLQLDKWRTHCIAVRKFTGFAQDDNINKEIQALLGSLNKHITEDSAAVEAKGSYNIAQYNAPFRPSNRLNEVWINVFGPTACPPSQ